MGHEIGLGTLPLPCLPTLWFQQTVLSLGKPWRPAKAERPDAAPCVLPRSASGALRRWSPSPRSRISQPAAGLCPAASARSARARASRYTAPSLRCCLGAHSGACHSHATGRVRDSLYSRPLPPPSACPTGLQAHTCPPRGPYTHLPQGRYTTRLGSESPACTSVKRMSVTRTHGHCTPHTHAGGSPDCCPSIQRWLLPCPALSREELGVVRLADTCLHSSAGQST